MHESDGGFSGESGCSDDRTGEGQGSGVIDVDRAVAAFDKGRKYVPVLFSEKVQMNTMYRLIHLDAPMSDHLVQRSGIAALNPTWPFSPTQPVDLSHSTKPVRGPVDCKDVHMGKRKAYSRSGGFFARRSKRGRFIPKESGNRTTTASPGSLQLQPLQ